MGAVATGARDLTENAFFGGNKTNAEILSNMGFSLVTQAGISYVGDTLVNRMNAANANSELQGCEKAEVDYSERNGNNGHYLHRPYIRKGTIDAINANTEYNESGQIWDKISRMYVDSDKVELGHKAGNEFWKMRNWAESQNMTQAEFNDYMNNPDFYAWQDIHSNRSHAHELP